MSGGSVLLCFKSIRWLKTPPKDHNPEGQYKPDFWGFKPVPVRVLSVTVAVIDFVGENLLSFILILIPISNSTP